MKRKILDLGLNREALDYETRKQSAAGSSLGKEEGELSRKKEQLCREPGGSKRLGVQSKFRRNWGAGGCEQEAETGGREPGASQLSSVHGAEVDGGVFKNNTALVRLAQ